MNLDEKIKQHIPQDELLAQLVEECAELSQAALKLRRALTGINPTPVTADEARKNLVEEAADVYNVLGRATGCCGQRRDIQYHSAEKGKMAEKTGGLTAWRL